MLDHGHSFLRILAWQLCTWNLWVLPAPWIVRSADAVWTSSWRRYLPMFCMQAVVLIVVHIVIGALLMVWFQPFVPVDTYGYATALAIQGPSLLASDAFIYVLLVIVGVISAARRRAHALELRESRLAESLARAQLEALRLEIQPHFLFNTLNSIAALIRSKDNTGALHMLLQLSELLRATVDRSADALTPLEAELEFLNRYIELQRLRFGERLDVVIDVPRECLKVDVPTFLLQPLVENALRHGVATVARPCKLVLRAGLGAGEMRIRVSDDGRGLPAGFDLERDAGTGLRNARARLEQIYGGAATLAVLASADGPGTVVELALPLSPAPAMAKAV